MNPMDPTKKRKLDDDGLPLPGSGLNKLSIEDVRKIVEPLTQEQLLQIVQNAALIHLDVLDAVRSIADFDTTQRTLFIRGLGWETTTEKLRGVFSDFGELEEAVVILDKTTGKSKGYGVVIYKHMDGALLALKEPSKNIDGRMTITQLASAGIQGTPAGLPVGTVDVYARKIYVANVPHEMPGHRLLNHFLSYGELEEGPLGFDKATGKSKGYTLFVYKTAEGARAALVDPVKNIDGHQLTCKLATPTKWTGTTVTPPSPTILLTHCKSRRTMVVDRQRFLELMHKFPGESLRFNSLAQARRAFALRRSIQRMEIDDPEFDATSSTEHSDEKLEEKHYIQPCPGRRFQRFQRHSDVFASTMVSTYQANKLPVPTDHLTEEEQIYGEEESRREWERREICKEDIVTKMIDLQALKEDTRSMVVHPFLPEDIQERIQRKRKYASIFSSTATSNRKRLKDNQGICQEVVDHKFAATFVSRKLDTNRDTSFTWKVQHARKLFIRGK